MSLSAHVLYSVTHPFPFLELVLMLDMITAQSKLSNLPINHINSKTRPKLSLRCRHRTAYQPRGLCLCSKLMSPFTSIAFPASSIPWYSWSANVTFHILLYTCSPHTSAVPRQYEFCLRSFNVQLPSLTILKIFDSVTRKSFGSPLVKTQPSMPCQLLGYCLLYVPNLEYPLEMLMYSIHCTTHMRT